MVRVIVPASYGDIWIDGERKGRTGVVGLLEVNPGRHTLKVQNEYSHPFTQDFVVSAGEEMELTVNLTPLSVRVDLSGLSLGPDCLLAVNGGQQQSVGSISGGLLLVEPQKAHTFSVTCLSGAPLQCDVRASMPDAFTKPSCR